MRLLRRLALLIALAPLPLAASAAGGTERLRDFLDDMRTLSARFEQAVYDESMKPVESSAGRVWIHRPGRFRWEYAAPFEQEIVSDGTRVWVHDPDLRQVTVRDLDVAIGSSPAVLLSGDRPLEETFAMTDLGHRGGIDWVELRPLGDEAGFREFRLGFDAEGLRYMELLDGFGQLTRLQFDDRERDAPLADELFRFEPPPGTDVIGE